MQVFRKLSVLQAEKYQSWEKGIFPGFSLHAWTIKKLKQPTDDHVIRENRWLLSLSR